MTLNTKTGIGTQGLARSRYRADNHRKRLKRYLSRPPAKGSVYPWLYSALPYTPSYYYCNRTQYGYSCCSLRGDLILFISLRYQFHTLINTNLLELRNHGLEERRVYGSTNCDLMTSRLLGN